MWFVKHWKYLLYECRSAVFVKLVCYLFRQCLLKCCVFQICFTCLHNDFVQVNRCSAQILQSQPSSIQSLFKPLMTPRDSMIRVGLQENWPDRLWGWLCWPWRQFGLPDFTTWKKSFLITKFGLKSIACLWKPIAFVLNP